MKRLFLSTLTLVGLFILFPNQANAQADKTIVEIAAGNENFTTLVAAVKAADLAGTLSGEGPFTVFAPTDAAFAALPDGLVAALVKPENKEVLQKILTYHVIAAKLDAGSVVKGITDNKGMLSATTVSNGKFSVMTEMGKVKIKDAQGNVATVTATDITGSNGIIHVIDRVLLPAGVNPADLLKEKPMGTTSTKNLVEIAAGNKDFSTLVAAVKAADLAGTLSGEGPFTVFAPTDAAFAALPDGLVAALVKPENKEVLQKILTYHVIAAKLDAGSVVKGITDNNGMLSATTVSNGKFSVMTEMGKVKIKDAQGNVATVTATDIMGSNGIIHVIDRVLLPAGVNPADLLEKKPMNTTTMNTSFPTAPAGPTIAAVASGNDNFKTLVAALGAAGLVETFDSPGEYTVFAPTDAAFDALPDGTVNNLVTNQKDVLKGILAYHVIPAKVSAAKLIAAIKANKNYYMMQTLGGQTLVATMKGGNVQLIDAAGNRSTVVATDVEASNGIIHGIDAVVMPK